MWSTSTTLKSDQVLLKIQEELEIKKIVKIRRTIVLQMMKTKSLLSERWQRSVSKLSN